MSSSKAFDTRGILTWQFLTNQRIKIERKTWSTRDLGKKRSSPPVFLNNWLNFCVRGQFEIKILIVRGHSDINTTYIIYKHNIYQLAPAIIWKLVTCQQTTSTKYSTSIGRHLSPRYGQVRLFRGYLVLTAVNWSIDVIHDWSQHWCAISFLLGSQSS